MGKQGELMEQMAKAQRDRKKRELEEKLRESGDLPPAEDAAPKVSEAGTALFFLFRPQQQHTIPPPPPPLGSSLDG